MVQVFDTPFLIDWPGRDIPMILYAGGVNELNDY